MLKKLVLFIFTLIVSSHGWADNKFISIADIHFSPFLSCPSSAASCPLIDKLRQSTYQEWSTLFEQNNKKNISRMFQDTNYFLFKLSVKKIQDISKKEKIDFIIILGDFLAHDFRKEYIKFSGDKTKEGYEAFVKKTLQFMVYEFNTAFPQMDIYPVIGNNDSYSGDYSIIPNGTFLRDTAKTWSSLIKNKKNKDSFVQDFPKAGYYQIETPNHSDLKVIVLNTILFSSHNHNQAAHKGAELQLSWLHNQLKETTKNHQKTILVYHIPVGVDVYATYKNQFHSIKEFWWDNYTKKFEDELNYSVKVIQGIYCAHIHVDTFQIIALQKLVEIPVYFTPSISPIYGNNPGFKVFTYNLENFNLEEARLYSLKYEQGSEPVWQAN